MDYRNELDALRARRDEEIRRLADEGHASPRIAAMVNCSRATVYEVAHPDRRSAYGRRRRSAWHLRAVS